jgi:hypothetical protein
LYSAITNFVEQRSSGDICSCSAGEEIRCLLCNKRFRLFEYQLNAVYILTPYLTPVLILYTQSGVRCLAEKPRLALCFFVQAYAEYIEGASTFLDRPRCEVFHCAPSVAEDENVDWIVDVEELFLLLYPPFSHWAVHSSDNFPLKSS